MPPGIGNKKVQQLRLARKKLIEKKNLWPHNSWRSDGFKFKLECPKNRGGCNPELDGTIGCSARLVLSQQQDFREQKGQLQEDSEVQAANHLIIFYPKFHCELNFIERFWCAAKWYARENCEYSLEGLRKIVLLHWTQFRLSLSIGTIITTPR